MKTFLMSVFFIIFCHGALADVQYFNGKIERIEVCKSNGGTIFIYFKDIVGVAPAKSNGCSNDVAFPLIWLNHKIGELTEFDKVILSTALTAQASERSVRVRYDDQTRFLQSLAVD